MFSSLKEIIKKNKFLKDLKIKILKKIIPLFNNEHPFYGSTNLNLIQSFPQFTPKSAGK